MNAPSRPVANILVADDVVENLRLLTSMLGEQGYEVRAVTNGRQALQAAERDPPDLILLDINMPEMNGFEVCRRLKANAALSGVPVIFLTALDDIADKVTAFGAGGIDYITKPFSLEEVSARVRTHIALRQASLEVSRSYAQLRELERARDDLVHMIVHDMRSPLMALLGHLELVQSACADSIDAESREDLKSAETAARALNQMANDLLDVSRLEQGQLPLVLSSNDLGALATEVQSALRTLDLERLITVHADARVLASCDASVVRRVLENLVSNAVKHTPIGAGVSIHVRATTDGVRVEVVDAGDGIPAEARLRIFEKFGTLAVRTAQEYHSAGLGLAFCKLAVEAHGGLIGVKDAKPRGSVFWFELPARLPGFTAA